MDQGRGTCGGKGEPHHENTIHLRAAYAAIAIATATPAAAHGPAKRSRRTSAGDPNIPGKSLIAVVVDYAPGGASPSHTHAKSAFIFAYVLSGEIDRR